MQKYGTGQNSTIGKQLRTDMYQKKALIEAAKEQYFGQMADTTAMPKHMGKTIKRYHYLPMLDDANINDQGIDAAGAVITQEKTIIIIQPGLEDNIYTNEYAVGEGANSGAAVTAAQAKAVTILGVKFGIAGADYAAKKAAAIAAGYQVIDDAASVPISGNLYGSSKDVGYISGKLPVLSEQGGRVNRVGFKRREIESNLNKFGFFDEYTQESLDFDTDEELDMHINREMVRAANEINEDLIQIDLLNAPGVIRFGGAAVSTNTVTGEGTDVSLVTYEDLMRLSIELDDNRCPKNTKIITGTRMVDTKVVDAARFMFIGSELIPMVKKMKDLFNNPAFIGVQHYAAGTTVARGEIGQVGDFRIIVVPEMMHWAGAGATATAANEGYRETGGKYDVFPMLVVGDESFTTVGFQTDGKSVKFTITHKKPGKETADRNDPYGETGFMSIKWYYGFMALRPERIAVVKTVAEW